jgi:hypothetical protein
MIFYVHGERGSFPLKIDFAVERYTGDYFHGFCHSYWQFDDFELPDEAGD